MASQPERDSSRLHEIAVRAAKTLLEDCISKEISLPITASPCWSCGLPIECLVPNHVVADWKWRKVNIVKEHPVALFNYRVDVAVVDPLTDDILFVIEVKHRHGCSVLRQTQLAEYLGGIIEVDARELAHHRRFVLVTPCIIQPSTKHPPLCNSDVCRSVWDRFPSQIDFTRMVRMSAERITRDALVLRGSRHTLQPSVAHILISGLQATRLLVGSFTMGKM
jgi:hypothetical protein